MSKGVFGSLRTETQTKVTTVGTLSGFQEFFLQYIIKDRPKRFLGNVSMVLHAYVSEQ